MMIATLNLELYGYQLIFNFTELNKTGTILEGFIELVPKPGMEGPTVTSIEAGTTLKDIRRLREYLDDHMVQKADQNSYEFVPEFLNFWLQARTGYITADPGGYFTVIVMLNIGRDPGRGLRVHMGVYDQVSVQAVQSFMAAIDDLLARFDKRG